jgi:hypothetical protein
VVLNYLLIGREDNMKKMLILIISIFLLCSFPLQVFSETIDVHIKGVDDGKKTTKQRDYMEALMNAKLQAIERAGVEIQSITMVENFQLKYDLVESKAKAVLLPGFQVEDIGYQIDGTYLVVLIGKIQVGELGKTKKSKGAYWGKLRAEPKIMEVKKKENVTSLQKNLQEQFQPGMIKNDFENNGNGTITDWATGLMWSKEDLGSETCPKNIKKAIERLNDNKFAGYFDWRIPTLEELASIVTAKPKSKGVDAIYKPAYCIDPIFAPPNKRLWSADTVSCLHCRPSRSYIDSCRERDPYTGRLEWDFAGVGITAGVYVGIFNEPQIDVKDTAEYSSSYIKAVRSID